MAYRGERLEQVGRRGAVPKDRLPRLVTFRDTADPTSVERVDPDDLASTFGPGVRLESVTLEIVDQEPGTRGRACGEMVPWLEAVRPRTRDAHVPLIRQLPFD